MSGEEAKFSGQRAAEGEGGCHVLLTGPRQMRQSAVPRAPDRFLKVRLQPSTTSRTSARPSLCSDVEGRPTGRTHNVWPATFEAFNY